MRRFDIPGYSISSAEAWRPREVREAVEACLEDLADRLPDQGDSILIKPDLSCGRLGVVGGSSDLRVLVAVVEALRDRGHRQISLGDAPPPAFLRAAVEPVERLRVDRFIRHYGLRWLDLNQEPTVTIQMPAGVARVARAAFDAELVINLPSLRTHPQAGLVLGCWNLKGLVYTDDRSIIRRNLSRNLVTLAERIRPGITIVDALVGMEGEGPFEGTPTRIGRLFWGCDVLALDLVVSRLFGYSAEEVTHLWSALRSGVLKPEAQIYVEKEFAVMRDLKRPRVRSAAHRTGHLVAGWARGMIQARADSPGWSALARATQLGARVDPRKSELESLLRKPERCGSCNRCTEFCPVGLKRDEIGLAEKHPRCIDCLYCLQVCGFDALSIQGEGGALLESLYRDRAAMVHL